VSYHIVFITAQVQNVLLKLTAGAITYILQDNVATVLR